MTDEKIKDTLFIDMKYIILYRKLGYVEAQPDVFIFRYADTEITIESEMQRFQYLGKHHPLTKYRDFVLLECIDRLLKKGYSSSEIEIPSEGCDLVIKRDGRTLVRIFVAQWGSDFEALVKNHTYDGHGIECLYSSQLSGGLVDHVMRIFSGNMEYDKGLFDKGTEPYDLSFSSKAWYRAYPSDLVVEDDELLKYLGKESILVIPDGIRRIGPGAFWNNLDLREVFLPDSVTTICGDSFAYCENLVKANIPSNVDEIGDDPWAGCLNVVIMNESPNFIIDDGAIFDKNGRTLIHYFTNNRRERYRVPESVEWIGKHSFFKCPYLKEVVITKNVQFMGNNAFSDCQNVILKNESPYFHYVDGVLYNRDVTLLMHYSMGSDVKEVRIADTVRTIGRNSFWNCKMIEKMVIPPSVRQVGYNPFANCPNIVFENHSPYYSVVDNVLYNISMEELVCCPSSAARNGVKIPDTVLNIGRNAFTGCESLKRVIIPESVRYISRGAFSGCINLEEALIPSTVREIGDWCFNDCISLKKIRVPSHVKLGPNTFKGCDLIVERF